MATARSVRAAATPAGVRDLSAEVAFLTRALKAPTLRESVTRLAERARAESWSHEEFLVACLQREVAARESHGGEGRIRAARFPARKSLEEFDFDHARGLKRDVIAHLGAFYRCYAPEVVPLRALVRVAGRRWTVEESFQAGKGLAGLDEHQVRRWTSWQRWTLLAMVAHALLAVIAASEHALHPASDGLIALTCNEIRRLFVNLVIEPGRSLACPQAWSLWRRRHQHHARNSHYRRHEDQHAWI